MLYIIIITLLVQTTVILELFLLLWEANQKLLESFAWLFVLTAIVIGRKGNNRFMHFLKDSGKDD